MRATVKPRKGIHQLAACALLGLGLVALTPRAAQAAGPECRSVSTQTCDLAKSLGRGINFGNMLEAPREGDWGLKVEPRFIDLAAASFATVRLPVRWSNHAAATADAKLDEVFAQRVDAVVDALLAKGLNVILDFHHYNQLNGDARHPNEFAVDPAVLEVRFVNIWRQVAERYKNRSNKLVFELLNEPHGRLNGEPWNVLAQQALTVVRQSNPSRAVMIGPSYWNNAKDLPKLRMPADLNLILSLHSYDPLGYTHQGVSWIAIAQPVGTECCDAAQRKSLTTVLDQAKAWSDSNGYPVHLGEFGVVNAAPLASRATYASFARHEAEARGFGWAYWELASSFGVYDPKLNQWVEPVRKALLD